MPPILWDRTLETGNEELDAQHRLLIDTFNRLAAVVSRQGWKREELEGLLVFLRDFTMAHFELEQEMMVRSSYPLEAEHRLNHADLATQMDRILEGFQRGETALTPVILEELDAWLTRHIREEDFRLAEFLVSAETQQRG